MKKNKKNTDNIIVSFIDEPASDGVTGSMVYIKTPYHKILLDAGFFQSNDLKTDYMINNRIFKEFKPKEIDYLFLSHNHGDHIFETPLLYKRGFQGKTIIPENSGLLLKAMIDDCCYINQRDIDLLNEKENKNYKPLFEETDVDNMFQHIYEYPILKKIKIDDNLSIEFIPSGHLESGCQIVLYISLYNQVKKILYTGDLGNPKIPQPFVYPFKPINKVNLVIGESTYASKKDLKINEKARQKDIKKIKSIIDNQIIKNKGKLLIPVFAQARAQMFAYIIYQLYKDDKSFKTKIYIDSPLACRVFELFYKSFDNENKIEFEKLLKWENLVFVKEGLDSKKLIESNESCIILSSSGMCTNGRVKNHIKRLVSNPNATILFVGYSAEGTLASLLKDEDITSVKIDMVDYIVRCAVFSLTTFSSHMPYQELLNYYSSIICDTIVLHHGIKDGKMQIKKELENEINNQYRTTKVLATDSKLKIIL